MSQVDVNKPTLSEAVKLLQNYTMHRTNQHNTSVQMLHNITQCLQALPVSTARNFVLADFERRIAELVGESKGRDARVTEAMVSLMSEYPVQQAVDMAEKIEVFKLTLHDGVVQYCTTEEEIEILKDNMLEELSEEVYKELYKYYSKTDWIEQVEMSHKELSELPQDDRSAELFSPKAEVEGSDTERQEPEPTEPEPVPGDEEVESAIDEIVGDEGGEVEVTEEVEEVI